MTLAVNDLLTVFGMAPVGRGHSSRLFSNFTLGKEMLRGGSEQGPLFQEEEEGASISG